MILRQAEPEQRAPNEGSIWCIYRTVRAVWQLYKIVDWRRESGFIVGWAYIVGSQAESDRGRDQGPNSPLKITP